MKQLLIICIIICLFLPHPPSDRIIASENWSLNSGLAQQYNDYLFQEEQTLNEWQELQSIKALILNGQTVKAKYLLNKLRSHDNSFEILKYRYMILLDFIDNRFSNGLKIINTPQLDSPRYRRELCLMKIIFLFALNQTEELDPTTDGCFRTNQDYLRQDGLWLSMLLKIKDKDPLLIEKKHLSRWFPDIQYISEDILATWLKIGIYLGQEKEMRSVLLFLDELTLRYEQIRELAGLYYYRLGEFSTAKKLVENLQTPNAQNIMGNILINEKKYDLAFKQFDSAQQKKRNSLNAVERGASLSWLIGEWAKGEKMVEKLPDTPHYQKQKLGLLAAFALQQQHYDDVGKYLDQIHQHFGDILPLDLNLLGAYYSLISKDDFKLRYYSDAACRQFDAASCLLLIQNELWPELSKLLLSPNKVLPDKEFSVTDLKKSVTPTPLSDILILEQRDIEELDVAEYELKYFNKELNKQQK